MSRDRNRNPEEDQDLSLAGLVPLGALDGSGMGDMPNEEFDPHQRRTIVQHGQMGKTYNDVMREGRPALTKAEEDATVERGKLFADVLTFSKLFFRRPNYLDPPLSSKPIDVYTDPVAAVISGATNALILRYFVPRGAAAIINKMGNDLDTPNAFPNVTFRLQYQSVNKGPSTLWFNEAGVQQRTYQNMNRKIGEPTCPCCLPMPIILTGPGFFEIRADNLDIVAHDIEFRFQGWEWTPEYSSTRTDINAEFLL